MKFVIFSILTLLIYSCEQVVKNVDLPYDKQLVIEAYLDHGEPVDDITITKTLPPLDNYVFEEALVEDLDGEIIDDSGNSFPLIYLGNGVYEAENLIPEIGRSYTLSIEWENEFYTANTRIPDTCNFISIQYDIQQIDIGYGEEEYEVKVSALVENYDNAVYEAYTYINNDDIEFANKYITRKNEENPFKVQLNEFYLYSFEDEPIDTNDVDRYFAGGNFDIYSYDLDYEAFFRSRNEGDSGDDIFGISGINVQGNINNGIGIFVGRSKISGIIKTD